MIELEFIERLIRTLDESGLDHVEIEQGDARLRISRSPPAVWGRGSGEPPDVSLSPIAAGESERPGATSAAGSGADAPGSRPGWVDVPSPMVGTFYSSPSPGADPFVQVGSEVSPGDVLCIIEAMKLMNEFEAEISGRIGDVCVQDGEPVEFGQILFRVEPS